MVKQGLATADDFRFVRSCWEVPPQKIAAGTLEMKPEDFCKQTFTGKHWALFAKGGAYSPYHADLHLTVNWEQDGKEIRNFSRAFIRNESFYFRPELTWPLRTNGLSFRVSPAGCVFGHKGPMAFISDNDRESLLALAALMNSCSFYIFVQMLIARVALAQSFEVGIIQSIPLLDFSGTEGTQLRELAGTCLDLKRNLDRSNETDHIFHLPALLQASGNTLAERLAAWQARIAETEQRLAECQCEIDDIAFRLYGFEGEDRRAIEEVVGGQSSIVGEEENEANEIEEEAEGEPSADAHGLVVDLTSYVVGCTMGRWDVRFATGEKQTPELPDPFAPLPVCSPGMLTGEDGLPLDNPPPDYPIQITQDGLLVDDPDHRDGIVRRVQEVLEVLWRERATAIEQEACEILDVRDLHEYFRRPAGFFDNHLKRYSKSRRRAPIYWLLSTSSGSYTVWVYYHRLTDQTLYTIVNRYVEPKIAEVERTVAVLEKDITTKSGREASQLEDRRREA